MEILVGFIVVWLIMTAILTFAWAAEPGGDYPLEFLWWPIWLVTIGLMRLLKSIKRAISEEWNK